MNPIRQLILISLLSFTIIGVNSVFSEVMIDPFGIAAAVERNGEEALEISLINSGEEAVLFNIDLDPPEERLVGPRRDELGDAIRQYETGQEGWMGLAWDGELMWGVINNTMAAWDPNAEEFVENINVNRQCIGMAYDGETFWTGQIGDGNQAVITNIDREGNIIDEQIVPGFIITGIACENGDIWYYSLDFEGGQMLLNKITPEGEEIAVYDIGGIIQDLFVGLAWVPEHRGGNLWIMGISDGSLFQVDVDGDELRVVQEGAVNNQNTFGFEHDGENLWYSCDDANWYVIDDGIAEAPPWITLEPREGEIAANDEELIEIFFTPGELENGLYELIATVEFTEAGNVDNMQTSSFSIVMSIGLDVAELRGTVIDAETNQAISNAKISIDRFEMIRFSSERGIYSFPDLPWGEYVLTCEADDYLPFSEQIVIDQDGVFRQNIGMLHADCDPDIEEIVVELETDEIEEIVFTVSNNGNDDLAYNTDLRLRDEADILPWELRSQIMASQILNEPRVQGVVYIDNRFYIAGSNNRNAQIYILNNDGELIDQFDQFGIEGSYGYKDLAFDGELIWGADGPNIYGFTPDGNLVHEIGGPFNPNNNLAWDSDRELLWVSSTTTNIIGINRDGNEIWEIPRNEQRIYGLAYWPDDPDGCPLYLYHRTDDLANQFVSKVNPENEEIIYVQILSLDAPGSPMGSYITNQYDLYSWVFITVVNDAGNDRVEVWQLCTNTDWMNLNPTEGIIAANQAEEFTFTLNSEGLLTGIYEGQIIFYHNGVGSETAIPVTMTVIEMVVIEQRSIQLNAGWNMVSINVDIENTDVIDLTQNMVDNENLLIVKDGDGRFYAPEFGFINIPRWEVSEGYLIKMRAIDDLWCEGTPIRFDRPIPLRRGWQLVSYYPGQAVDARTAFSNIVDCLILAKDGDGMFYTPRWNFCNMGNLSEGFGYQLNMTEDIDLIYVLGDENALNHAGDEDNSHLLPKNSAFPVRKITPVNMSLLLIGETHINGEIGIYSNDRFIGSGTMLNGKCGVAVWGDDPSTVEVDGALQNERFRLVFADADEKRELDFIIIEGDGLYKPDDFQAVELQNFINTPEEFGIISAYPNPFNNSSNIQFNLTETGNITLALYDLNGRLVENLFSGKKTAGQQFITVSAASLSSGVYILQLSAEGNISKKKLTLLK